MKLKTDGIKAFQKITNPEEVKKNITKANIRIPYFGFKWTFTF